MKLFEMKNWQLTVSEEVWGLSPFKKILTRDKTKDKTKALAEVLYVWYYCDIKSDYLSMSEEDKVKELVKDIDGLEDDWQPDEVIEEAIQCYNKFKTVIQQLYEDSLQSCRDIGEYIRNTKALLAERDVNGKPVYDIAKLTTANEKVPKLMANLKAAYKEVVKEQEDLEGKKKGSRKFNLFEEGIKYE